jgi:hypothetical protein
LGFNSRGLQPILHKPESQPQGATWQPMTGLRGTFPLAKYDATFRALVHPPVYQGVNSILPHHCPVSLCHCIYHVSLLTSSRATCHPYSGDTCHPQTGPVACHTPYHLPCVFSRSFHVICTAIRPLQSACHVALYGLYSHPFFLPVWVFEQNAISFAYGARLTK